MRIATALFSFIIVGLYVAVVLPDPSRLTPSGPDVMSSLFSPRGGIATLAISLVFANVAVWLAGQRHRSMNQRFQLTAAVWIWLLVQAGSLVYLMYEQVGTA